MLTLRGPYCVVTEGSVTTRHVMTARPRHNGGIDNPARNLFSSSIVTKSYPPFDSVLARVDKLWCHVETPSLVTQCIIPIPHWNTHQTQLLMRFRLNSIYAILLSLTSGEVVCLAFSNVQPAALATHAFNDIPRLILVLAVDSVLSHVIVVDSVLVHDTSLVDSMST